MQINADNSLQLSGELELHLMQGMQIHGTGLLSAPCMVYPNVTLYHSSLGGHSYISTQAEVGYTDIGNYTSIASGFVIGLGHPMHLLTASPVAWRPFMPNSRFDGQTTYRYERTVIGSDVWIGANVIVKAGVTIGDGCVVGAGSVVTRSIAPFTVAAGNPCRPIRPRFTSEIQGRIEHIRWYDHDWRDETVDWSSTDGALDSMEAALTQGFGRPFRRIRYEADNTNLNLMSP